VTLRRFQNPNSLKTGGLEVGGVQDEFRSKTAQVRLECLVAWREHARRPRSNVCLVEAVKQALFPSADYAPGPSIWDVPTASMVLPTALMRGFEVSAK
jgi:hypothetical protein